MIALLLPLIAISAPPTPEDPGMFPIDDPLAEQPREPAQSLSVKVAIDAEPSGKKFQGVWLVRDDGERWLVAYRPLPLWKIYEGVAVNITGAVYQPDGQSISATHFRVDTLSIRDPQAIIDPRSFGPEQTFEGQFESESGSPGSKSEGSTWTVFRVQGGLRYEIMNPVAVDRTATSIRARTVERSPFVAHRGGPALWLVDP